jgi:endonuclease G, mitochondrial
LTTGEGVNRNKSSFREDPDIPLMFRALLKDYVRSGYDRGHQAPAADATYTQIAMDETFLLSNMAPQVGVGFNRGCKCTFIGCSIYGYILIILFNREDWAYLEEFVRSLVEIYPDVWVWTGELFLPQKGDDGKYYIKYQVMHFTVL